MSKLDVLRHRRVAPFVERTSTCRTFCDEEQRRVRDLDADIDIYGKISMRGKCGRDGIFMKVVIQWTWP